MWRARISVRFEGPDDKAHLNKTEERQPKRIFFSPHLTGMGEKETAFPLGTTSIGKHLLSPQKLI